MEEGKREEKDCVVQLASSVENSPYVYLKLFHVSTIFMLRSITPFKVLRPGVGEREF